MGALPERSMVLLAPVMVRLVGVEVKFYCMELNCQEIVRWGIVKFLIKWERYVILDAQ